jgi:ABC-type glycerol-3-phosphate transport system substrate-binding protein
MHQHRRAVPGPWRRTRVATAAALLSLAAAAACGPRQVAVRTGEATAAESTIEFTNNLSQAVNVYVRPNTGAGEIFLRQVAAQATETIPVRGVAPGTAVRLRATPVSGNPNYERENVVLGRGFAWAVP